MEDFYTVTIHDLQSTERSPGFRDDAAPPGRRDVARRLAELLGTQPLPGLAWCFAPWAPWFQFGRRSRR